MSKCRGLHCDGCQSGGSGGYLLLVLVVIIGLAIWRALDSAPVRHAIHVGLEVIFWGAIAAAGIGLFAVGWTVGSAIYRRRARARLAAPVRVTLSPPTVPGRLDAAGRPALPSAVPEPVYGPLRVIDGGQAPREPRSRPSA